MARVIAPWGVCSFNPEHAPVLICLTYSPKAPLLTSNITHSDGISVSRSVPDTNPGTSLLQSGDRQTCWVYCGEL